MRWIRRIKYRLIFLFKFIKLGWQFNDWDFEYSKRVFTACLRMQLDLFQSDRSVADWDYDAESRKGLKSLRIAVKLLEAPEFEAKGMPEIKWSSIPVEGKNYSEMKFDNTKEELDKVRELVNMEERINIKRERIAFDIIKKYNRYWWD